MRTLIFAVVISGMSLLGGLKSSVAQSERGARLQEFIKRFDKNGDGRLSQDERSEMRDYIKSRFNGANQAQQEVIPPKLDPQTCGLYGSLDGELKSISREYDLVIPGQDRPIPLRFTIPQGDGPYPLIIFCHGAGGSNQVADPLVNRWASHGYVVIRPTFGDSISELSGEERRKFSSVQEFVASAKVMSQWDARPKEVIAVLDALSDLEKAVPEFAGTYDKNLIAVAGHSYGAHTSMMLSGLKLMGPLGSSTTISDPRIKCAIFISPQGPGQGIKEESYAAIDRPAMVITGDNDHTPRPGKEELTGEWRRHAFDDATPGDKYLLWVKDAHHSFGGINGLNINWAGAGPKSLDQVLLVQAMTLAFFDAYLKESETAKAALVDRDFSKKCKELGTMSHK